MPLERQVQLRPQRGEGRDQAVDVGVGVERGGGEAQALGAATATSLSLVTAASLNYLVVSRRLEIEIAVWSNLRRR